MPNLSMNRIDPSAAAELVRANVQETLPSAGVQLRTIGDPQQPTFRKAVGQGFSDLMSARGRTMFAVVADCNAPRPVRIEVRYAGVGRGAGPISILYLARLRQRIHGAVAFRRSRLRNGTFAGDPDAAAALSAVPSLGSATWKMLQEKTVYGSIFFTIEPAAEVVPDDDGAILAVVSAPARRKLGFAGFRLDLGPFLDLAGAIEGGLATAPGVTPAPTMNAPLPD